MPALAVNGTGKFGWGSLLSSGDFDFITSASGTAVASLSIDNCFSAGYDHYLVMRNLYGSYAGDDPIDVRLRVGGVDASGADYRYQYLYAASTSVSGSRLTGNTHFQYGLGYAQPSAACGFSRTWISNPFAAARTTLWTDAAIDPDANIALISYVQEHDQATSYDGFTIRETTYGETFTGSLYVYGLAV